ncbi:MAG: hypothetical protein H3C26_01760 [Rhodocyclaceae bacterium]|nr:hypothetical protein [Rhodocyclaceae bacterium]
MLAFALLVWAGILLLCHALWGWVPILDFANLAFHEAGHPLFGLISGRLAVYGGTLMQLLIPAACAFEMHRQGKPGGQYFCLIWFAENLLNVARYMADARAQRLPLVGGLNPEEAHDWTRILGNWGLLSWDTTLAGLVRIAALALMAWVVWRAWQTHGNRPEPFRRRNRS